MRVHLGSDHAGFDLKAALVARLGELGHEPVDHGPAALDPVDDYPPFVLRAAQAVAAEPGSLGVVIGGSGNGEAIAANKVAGVRCALAWSEETARLGRQHNDANVVSRRRPDARRGRRPSRWSRRSSPSRTPARTGTPAASTCCRRYEQTGVLPPLP